MNREREEFDTLRRVCRRSRVSVGYCQALTLVYTTCQFRTRDRSVPRRKRRRPNFPYWGTLGLLAAIVVGTIAISSWITVEWGQGRYRMGWEQAVLSRSFETLIGLWFFAVGSSIASFLNVVAYRLPRRISINGFSRCPFCKVGIHGYDNIPLFGWLGLRGRCRACRLPIPARYPGFELLGGVIALAFFGFEFLQHGTNLPNVVDTSSSHGMLTGRMDWESWTRVLEHLVLIYWLLAVAMITWGLQVVPMRLYGTGALALLGWVLVYPSFYPVAIWPGWMHVESNTMSDATALWRNAYVHAALQWCVGGIVGACLAVGMWFCGRMAKPIAEEFATPMFASWIGAWILIGNAFGWYAVLSTACLSIVIYGAKVSLIKMLGVSRISHPIAWLWLAASLQILFWKQWDRILGWSGQSHGTSTVFGLVASVLVGYAILSVLWVQESFALEPAHDESMQEALISLEAPPQYSAEDPRSSDLNL